MASLTSRIVSTTKNEYEIAQDSHNDSAHADQVVEVDALGNPVNSGAAKFAVIAVSSSGVTQLIAAVTLKKIRVLSYVITANAAVNAKFQSHVAPTDKSGLLYFGANGGVSAPYSPTGHFETIAGEALDINLSGAVAVGGHLTYVEV